MIVIGLTGSIGMGKSTVTNQLVQLGAKACNSDDVVHRLMARGGAAVDDVRRRFPTVVKDGAVDRKALGDIVFKDKVKLYALEQLLHPLVVAEEYRFANQQRLKGTKIIVLDIPLLFETGADERCDMTVVVTAPYFIQRQRVMKRPHMTEQKFQSILRSQLPDREKQERGDVVVQTGLGKARSFKDMALLVKKIREHI